LRRRRRIDSRIPLAWIIPVLIGVVAFGAALVAFNNDETPHLHEIGSPVSAKVRGLVNNRREERGLRDLRGSPSLRESAQRYADELDRDHKFEHASHIQVDSAWDWKGETLAYGQSGAREVVRAWMASPPHEAILMSGNARAMGVGHAGETWVAHFGSRR